VVLTVTRLATMIPFSSMSMLVPSALYWMMVTTPVYLSPPGSSRIPRKPDVVELVGAIAGSLPGAQANAPRVRRPHSRARHFIAVGEPNGIPRIKGAPSGMPSAVFPLLRYLKYQRPVIGGFARSCQSDDSSSTNR
jgi:hypothetical protein